VQAVPQREAGEAVKLRAIYDGRTARVVDAETGDEIEGVTAVSFEKPDPDEPGQLTVTVGACEFDGEGDGFEAPDSWDADPSLGKVKVKVEADTAALGAALDQVGARLRDMATMGQNLIVLGVDTSRMEESLDRVKAKLLEVIGLAGQLDRMEIEVDEEIEGEDGGPGPESPQTDATTPGGGQILLPP
jgi:hypothetical protein